MGGNPGEIVRNGEAFAIRAYCMCNRRWCVHVTWDRKDYAEFCRDLDPGNLTFRCIRAVRLRDEVVQAAEEK